MDDGFFFGKVSSVDSYGGGDDGGKIDGNINDGNGEGEFKDFDDVVVVVEGSNLDD